jgi:hypothetical protein
MHLTSLAAVQRCAAVELIYTMKTNPGSVMYKKYRPYSGQQTMSQSMIAMLCISCMALLAFSEWAFGETQGHKG